MRNREIIESENFTKCVADIGGYEMVDAALDLIKPVLSENPHSFHLEDTFFGSFRWGQTERIGILPPMSFTFQINTDLSVTMLHIEIAEGY